MIGRSGNLPRRTGGRIPKGRKNDNRFLCDEQRNRQIDAAVDKTWIGGPGGSSEGQAGAQVGMQALKDVVLIIPGYNLVGEHSSMAADL